MIKDLTIQFTKEQGLKELRRTLQVLGDNTWTEKQLLRTRSRYTFSIYYDNDEYGYCVNIVTNKNALSYNDFINKYATYSNKDLMKRPIDPNSKLSDEHDLTANDLNETQLIQIDKLIKLGVISSNSSTHRVANVGTSNYADFLIQPWSIWKEYNLNPWDADIVKRVLRTKSGDSRVQDYKKIIHIATEMIAQLEQK